MPRPSAAAFAACLAALAFFQGASRSQSPAMIDP